MDQILPEQPPQQPQKSNFLKKIPFPMIAGNLGLSTRSSKILFVLTIISILFISFFSYLLIPPQKFPSNETITIEKGSPLGSVALSFKEKDVIRSSFMFKVCMTALGGDKQIMAGDYVFKKPVGACSIAMRVVRGVSGIPMVRATIPEGASNQNIANTLSPLLPRFDARFFADRARAQEGFLFPDTYFFNASANTDEVIRVMSTEFKKKIEPWTPFIETSGHTEREIIIMASIIEKEAKTEEDQALVSGVLWKRIEKGIPLQVDAPFYYLLGKTSSELTQTDLAMKSAYNTYKNKGLPAGPIGNPGISTIRAAIKPKESPYLYYLSDEKGILHYARTFEEHKANKTKYIK